MKKDLEIPLGKRTPKYRFFEILPGATSYFMIILLFLLSYWNPLLGAIYLFIIIACTLVKAIGVAFRTVQGYNTVVRAQKVNWHQRFEDLKNPHDAFERLRNTKKDEHDFQVHVSNLKALSVAEPGIYPNPDKVLHAVMMFAYDESLDVMVPSVEAVKNTTANNEKIIFVLGYEERGGEQMEQNAKELKKRYEGVFKDFLIIKHPADLKGEVVGKGANATYAGFAFSEYLKKKRISSENVIVSMIDSDNRMAPGYLDSVAYEYVVHPNRQHMSFQPVALFMNNIWDVPALMRIVAVSNSFFNIITTMRPHALRNFAAHSQPLAALEGMGFWSKRTIVEDGHQYWRSLFYFDGDYEVVPIRVPIYQDAVISESFWSGIKAQFKQVRRWDYGASDVAYVGVRLFSKDRKIPFWQLFPKFVRLFDGHVTLAVMAPIVAFGAWVPVLMNFSSSRQMVAYNLPTVVSIVQTVASVGLFVTILISLKMLPKRPAKYSKWKTVMMVLQWVLMPISALAYQSVAAFYSQTRLMLGNYMEKFDVTKKR